LLGEPDGFVVHKVSVPVADVDLLTAGLGTNVHVPVGSVGTLTPRFDPSVIVAVLHDTPADVQLDHATLEMS
jgi:hypothetical protein